MDIIIPGNRQPKVKITLHRILLLNIDCDKSNMAMGVYKSTYEIPMLLLHTGQFITSANKK